MEEEMAIHSSICAWESPWTEEPGGYSPWGHKELDTTERPEEHRELRFPCAWQCSLKKKFKVSCFIFEHINIYLREI